MNLACGKRLSVMRGSSWLSRSLLVHERKDALWLRAPVYVCLRAWATSKVSFLPSAALQISTTAAEGLRLLSSPIYYSKETTGQMSLSEGRIINRHPIYASITKCRIILPTSMDFWLRLVFLISTCMLSQVQCLCTCPSPHPSPKKYKINDGWEDRWR